MAALYQPKKPLLLSEHRLSAIALHPTQFVAFVVVVVVVVVAVFVVHLPPLPPFHFVPASLGLVSEQLLAGEPSFVAA